MTAPKSHSQVSPQSDLTAAAQDGHLKARRLGHYELLSKIGQGAMGAIYLAHHVSQNPERKVALKVLPRELARDEEFLERFRREARAALKLRHPNICSAYDIGVAEGYHFIAMEYVDGPDLDTVLSKKGPFKEPELLKIALDICAALEAAHDMNIVHRDIKPSNVLVGSDGISKLIDMGLSSAAQGDRRVTIAGFAVGTPYYISPEQARGTLDADNRADFYSLGATLYHLATGHLPFSGTNPVVIMSQHIKETPPAPHERNPAVSRRLSALITKMMAKDPKRRHQNARDLRADIERVQRGEMPLLQLAAEQKPGSATPGVAPPPVRPAGTATKVLPAHPPLDERNLEKMDEWLAFLPQVWRVPFVAATATILLLLLLALVISLFRR